MLDEQIANHFTGRNKEIDAFIRWLEDPNAPWILYFRDALQDEERKGGVGKTWLLRKCAAIVEEKYPDIGIVSVDFYNIVDRDGLIVAKRVVDKLNVVYPDWSPTSLTQAMENHRITEDHNITAPDNTMQYHIIKKDLSSALRDDLRDLDKHIEHGKKSLLLFLDSFESIESDPTIAVLDPLQTFPDNYQFKYISVVIAGRNALNWNHPNWKGREQEIREILIAPFSPEEMVEYINKDVESQPDMKANSDETQELYLRTKGRPILLRLIIDALNDGTISFDELLKIDPEIFDEQLVPKILAFESSIDTFIILMAHIYHRFDQEILELLVGEFFDTGDLLTDADLNIQSLWTRILKLPFIRQAQFGGDVTLHDEMRRLVTEYTWIKQDPARGVRKSISQSILEYFERKIKEEQNQQKRQSYIIEHLYHLLYIDIAKGLQAFQKYFQEAIGPWNSSFARLLLLEAQKFESSMSVAQQSQLKSARAKLQAVEKNATASRYATYEGLAKLRGIESQPGEASQPKSPKTFRIYYSYANEDKELLERLHVHLAGLRRSKPIIDLDKRSIAAGGEVANRMEYLNMADIILLCISPDFISSELEHLELIRALERHKAKEAIVIPILFRPYVWKDAPFHSLQTIPRDSVPVISWSNPDAAFAEIAGEIEASLVE